MEIRTTSVDFSPLRRDGPRTAREIVVFPREVERATAGIAGYSAGFESVDHPLGHLEVRVDTEIDANVVATI
jgi:hypothetical protein